MPVVRIRRYPQAMGTAPSQPTSPQPQYQQYQMSPTKKKKALVPILIGVVFVVLAMVTVSCSGSTPNKITYVSMATGIDKAAEKPIGVATTFASNTPALYAIYTMSGYPIGTKSTGIWYYTEPDNKTTEFARESNTTTSKPQTQFFFIDMPKGGWPEGDYEVKILINGTNAESLKFKVK